MIETAIFYGIILIAGLAMTLPVVGIAWTLWTQRRYRRELEASMDDPAVWLRRCP